uniref:Putative juvenile hormone acid o-methyltransferase-like protein n=1 Tax=Lutzomyia longipalpis TaxID=7200 RepID=A0A1B0CRM3_LUTLO
MNAEYNTSLFNKYNRFRESELKTIFSKYNYLLKWTPNAAILDVGCGTGDISLMFIYSIIPKDYKCFVCTDISAKMLQEAEKKFEGKPRVFFKLLDITKDLKETYTYDHIFSMWCLMWVEDQKKAFKNIYDLLAPGGKTFHVLIQKLNVVQLFLQIVTRNKWMKFFPNVDKMYPFPYQNDLDPVKRIRTMMEDIGYVNVEVYLEKNTFAFANEEEFVGFLRALPNPFHVMSAKEQEDILREAIELAFANNVITESESRVESTSKTILPYFIPVRHNVIIISFRDK